MPIVVPIAGAASSFALIFFIDQRALYSGAVIALIGLVLGIINSTGIRYRR